MDFLRGFVPAWAVPPPAAPPDEDIEYIEYEEVVPKNSWTDFYMYLTGQEEDEGEKPSASLSHTTSVSTADSDHAAEISELSPSFSQIMANIVSSSAESGHHHESSEDEGHSAGT
jgi:hypothetical protein